MKRLERIGIALALGGALWSAGAHLDPGRARACGGLFCNVSQPVNQAAERIIFAKGADGVVTAVIEVQYSGPSDRFAWLLPVDGSPDVGVSSTAVLDALQQSTNPFYQLTTRIEGECDSGGGIFAGRASSDSASGAGAPPPSAPGESVTVVDRGSAGPYDYVIISVNRMLPDQVVPATEWLQMNGFDATPAGVDALRPYLESGQNILAIRLTSGRDTGAIRPIMLTFGQGLATIPIRPTASAANADMGILVFVLGQTRAIPANYRHLELNEALLNWLNPNSNYNAVVTRAANESGGQGFVTEMAGAAGPLGDQVFAGISADSFESLLGQSWTGRAEELVRQIAGYSARGRGGPFGGGSAFPEIDEVLTEQLPPPPNGISASQYYNCPECYGGARPDYSAVDVGALLNSLRTKVIDPLRATEALFRRHPYVTRLYTTMSPEDMTMDPSFDYNGDLGDYSNNHNAERVIECYGGESQGDAPWRVILSDGTLVRGVGNVWPFAIADEDMPATRRSLRVGTTGTGEVVTDNTAAIRAALTTHNAELTDTGCSATGTRGGLGAMLAGLLALVGTRFARSKGRAKRAS